MFTSMFRITKVQEGISAFLFYLNDDFTGGETEFPTMKRRLYLRQVQSWSFLQLGSILMQD